MVEHCAAQDKKQVHAKKAGHDKWCRLMKPQQAFKTLTQVK